ncbi:MAG TPA: hypothetical protein VK013_03050 [Myxococcaceae bacterium]|nr:hypothetical protein [Myxococcaceae bacterium]
MLDAFIIEEIRRRERVRQDRERPLIELPLPADDDRSSRHIRHDEEEKKPSRGVIVIDMAG